MCRSKENIPCQVVKNAAPLVGTKAKWDKHSEYGEDRSAKIKTYTLGCALKFVQLEIRGNKASRAKEMRVVRRKIIRHFFFRVHLHSYFQKTIT